MESLCGSLEAIAFPWSLIEFSGDAVVVALPDVGQALPLAEVLTQQSIGILVASSLSRVVWISAITAHAGCLLQGAVAMELGAVVPGDGLEWQATIAELRPASPGSRLSRCGAVRCGATA